VVHVALDLRADVVAEHGEVDRGLVAVAELVRRPENDVHDAFDALVTERRDRAGQISVLFTPGERGFAPTPGKRGSAPAPAPDGRRAPRLNCASSACGQGRTRATRDKNNRFRSRHLREKLVCGPLRAFRARAAAARVLFRDHFGLGGLLLLGARFLLRPGRLRRGGGRGRRGLGARAPPLRHRGRLLGRRRDPFHDVGSGRDFVSPWICSRRVALVGRWRRRQQSVDGSRGRDGVHFVVVVVAGLVVRLLVEHSRIQGAKNLVGVEVGPRVHLDVELAHDLELGHLGDAVGLVAVEDDPDLRIARDDAHDLGGVVSRRRAHVPLRQDDLADVEADLAPAARVGRDQDVALAYCTTV